MSTRTVRVLCWLVYLLAMLAWAGIWLAIRPESLGEALLVLYGSTCVCWGIVLGGTAVVFLADLAMEARK